MYIQFLPAGLVKPCKMPVQQECVVRACRFDMLAGMLGRVDARKALFSLLGMPVCCINVIKRLAGGVFVFTPSACP